MLLMTLIVALAMGIMGYAFIFYCTMPKDLQEKPLSFYVSTMKDQQIDENNRVQQVPQLLSLVPISYGYSSLSNEET